MSTDTGTCQDRTCALPPPHFHLAPWTTPAKVTVAQAFAEAEAAGVRVLNGSSTCVTFANKASGAATGRLLREVAILTHRPDLRRYTLRLHSDATRDEITTALDFATLCAAQGKVQPKRWSVYPVEDTFYELIGVCRPLDDYGDDLTLVERLPEVVTVDSILSGGPQVVPEVPPAPQHSLGGTR